MKKSIYICFLSVSFMFLSCDMNDKNEGRFEPDPNSGWVQFNTELIEEDYGTPATVIYGANTSQIVLPIELNVPINAEGTDVNYTITDINGTSASIITQRSGTVNVFKNAAGEVTLDGNIVIDINDSGLDSTVEFDVTITGTNRPNVVAGLPDPSNPATIRVKVCPFNVGLTYNATAVASTGFEGPEFVQTLVPVAGTTNQFTVETVWGTTFFPCFIGNCNNVAAIRRWPAILTINQTDFSVTVTGNDPAFPNRYPQSVGTYDPCTDTFNIPELKQAVLTSNPFTTNVTYTPVP